jgi:DNA-binding Lrp family transcriptional regulator
MENETLALVLIKTELGMAAQVAEAVSGKENVAWALVVTGPYDVVAAVKVPDNQELGRLIINRIQKIDGVSNPTTLVGVHINIGVEPFP